MIRKRAKVSPVKSVVIPERFVQRSLNFPFAAPAGTVATADSSAPNAPSPSKSTQPRSVASPAVGFEANAFAEYALAFATSAGKANTPSSSSPPARSSPSAAMPATGSLSSAGTRPRNGPEAAPVACVASP